MCNVTDDLSRNSEKFGKFLKKSFEFFEFFKRGGRGPRYTFNVSPVTID